MIAILLSMLLACQSNSTGSLFTHHDGQNSVFEGWFADHIEMELYPTRKVEVFIPYNTEENAKCISIINGTGKDRNAFRYLHKKRVRIIGKTIMYNELDGGFFSNDKVMNNKYYQGYQIQNYCYRKYLLIAQQIVQID